MHRQEKIQEAMRETAAAFLSREASRKSLVTVTRVEMSENGKRANILLTVLPESEEESAVSFANRHRREFAAFFKERVRGASLPHIEFLLDRGEKNRQRLDELSQ